MTYGPEHVLAFFIQDLREGGAERTVVRLANGVVALGIPTDLVVVRRQGSFFGELDRKVNVVELPQTRTATAVLGLRSYIERRRPRALVSHQTHTNVAAILANASARARTRLVVVEHNQFSKNRRLRRGLVRLAFAMVPLLYSRASSIAAVSADARDDLAAHTGIAKERILVLHNPVVTNALAELAAAPADHPWLRGGGPPVVLGVGRLVRQKNFELLIDAFAELRKHRPARLIILGDGERRRDLEARIRHLGITNDVDLPGFDPNPFRFMGRASAFVLSSDWEGLPTALIEAMACGTPVVATDCAGGIREILLDGKLGRISPVGDAFSLANSMAATLDAPGNREHLIRRANDFGVEQAVRNYLAAAGMTPTRALA